MPSESDVKCQFRLSHCKGMTTSPPPTGSWFYDEDQKGGAKGKVSPHVCDNRRSHWLNVCNAPYVECKGCTDPPKRGLVFSESCFKKDNSECKCVLETKGDDGWYTERTETNKDYSAGQLSYTQCRSLHASIFGGGGGGDDVLKTPSYLLNNVNKSVESTTKGVTNLKKDLEESKDAFSDFQTMFIKNANSSLKEEAKKTAAKASPHTGPSASAHAKR